MSTFLQILAAIPALIKLVLALRDAYGDNWGKYIADMGETFSKLNQADTADKKSQVASELAKLATRWGVE